MTKSTTEGALDFLIEVLENKKEQTRQGFLSQFNFRRSSGIRTAAKFRPLAFKLINKMSFSKIDLQKLESHLLFLFKSRGQYRANLQEKYFCLDFVHYVLKNNPEIPYKLFDSRDHREIERFVRHKFLLAFNDTINPKEIFGHQSRKKRGGYTIFRKAHPMVKHKGYWDILGFKSVVNHFEPAVFIGNYGLSLLPKDQFKNATVIDCGAFVGETAFIFNKKLQPAKIVALEPDPANYKNLQKNLALNQMRNIVAIPRSVSDSIGKVSLELGNSPGAHLAPGKESPIKVKVDTIDNLIEEFKFTNIKLIKMDIEGSELAAIRGAQKTIRTHKPALIISLYHRGQDFFEIPPLLKRMLPGYKMRFVNLNAESPTSERVLIAQHHSDD